MEKPTLVTILSHQPAPEQASTAPSSPSLYQAGFAAVAAGVGSGTPSAAGPASLEGQTVPRRHRFAGLQ